MLGGAAQGKESMTAGYCAKGMTTLEKKKKRRSKFDKIVVIKLGSFACGSWRARIVWL
jgi:hypothetical protein